FCFGLCPTLESFKGQRNESLKEGGRGLGGGVHHRVHALRVVWELALALVLWAGAGLLLNSFERLRAITPGFNPDKVLTCQVSLPSSKYKNPQIASFFQQLLELVRALPAVNAAGGALTIPHRCPN